jgi:endonuclease YncB( thermonuclease family)
MQILIACSVVAAAILHTSDPVLVKSVVDGHTLNVATIGRVRLVGIDASSSAGARERLASLVLHRWVRLEYENAADRHRAYVRTETGEFVNEILVRQGLARVARGTFARRGELERAELEAQRFRRGIWARYTRPRT